MPDRAVWLGHSQSTTFVSTFCCCGHSPIRMTDKVGAPWRPWINEHLVHPSPLHEVTDHFPRADEHFRGETGSAPLTPNTIHSSSVAGGSPGCRACPRISCRGLATSHEPYTSS
jgi:hypothetical protein